jgi:hypothetical protein
LIGTEEVPTHEHSTDGNSQPKNPGWMPPVSFDDIWGLARHVLLAGIAGVATGILVGGVGGRIFMRVAGASASFAQRRTTEAGFRVGEVTVGGTIALIVFVGLFVGVLGATQYVIFRPWLAWAKKWRGLVFGILLFAAGSATSDVMNPDNPDFVILKNEVLLVSMIVLLFLAFGVMLDWLFSTFDRRAPIVDRSAHVPLAVLAVFGLVIALVTIPVYSGGGCDCPAPVFPAIAIGAAAVGTLILFADAMMSGDRPAVRITAAVFGYVGLAGVLVFGLIRAISDAADIIRT